jgi:Icc-related predicted phosphoesterase
MRHTRFASSQAWNSSDVSQRPIKIAAAGDVHAGGPESERLKGVFADAAREADMILLAGDLTLHGEPEEAEALADAVRGLETPVVAVLGNHDWHANRTDEVVSVLSDAGLLLLDRDSAVVNVDGTEVGIAGVKGFVGGFPDLELPDFGEPSLRRVYAETTEEVDGLRKGLAAIAGCPLRIALLHYAPTTTTLEGEPQTIWAFLGSDRLAGPIAEHKPDIVLHGHGHLGTFEGFVGEVPVYNVAQQVIGKDYWVFELDDSGVRWF